MFTFEKRIRIGAPRAYPLYSVRRPHQPSKINKPFPFLNENAAPTAAPPASTRAYRSPISGSTLLEAAILRYFLCSRLTLAHSFCCLAEGVSRLWLLLMLLLLLLAVVYRAAAGSRENASEPLQQIGRWPLFRLTVVTEGPRERLMQLPGRNAAAIAPHGHSGR